MSKVVARLLQVLGHSMDSASLQQEPEPSPDSLFAWAARLKSELHFQDLDRDVV